LCSRSCSLFFPFWRPVSKAIIDQIPHRSKHFGAMHNISSTS
jgi:hypothetical protein